MVMRLILLWKLGFDLMEVGIDEVTLRIGKQANKRSIQFVLQAFLALFGNFFFNVIIFIVFAFGRNSSIPSFFSAMQTTKKDLGACLSNLPVHLRVWCLRMKSWRTIISRYPSRCFVTWDPPQFWDQVEVEPLPATCANAENPMAELRLLTVDLPVWRYWNLIPT